jgi:hypothetical protein
LNSLRCASQTHCCEATQSKGAVFESHAYLQVIKNENGEPSNLGGYRLFRHEEHGSYNKPVELLS